MLTGSLCIYLSVYLFVCLEKKIVLPTEKLPLCRLSFSGCFPLFFIGFSMAWRLSLIPCQGFPQHKSTMAGDYCFSKWVTCSVDEKHLKHTFSAVVWTGPGELAPRPRRSRKRPLPGLCYFSSRAWKVRFFCKTPPNALSTLQEMFPIVSQTHFFAGGTNWKKNSLPIQVPEALSKPPQDAKCRLCKF